MKNFAWDHRRTKDRIANRKSVPKHGTVSEYNNFGCRCEACTKAHTRYRRKLRSNG